MTLMKIAVDVVVGHTAVQDPGQGLPAVVIVEEEDQEVQGEEEAEPPAAAAADPHLLEDLALRVEIVREEGLSLLPVINYLTFILQP
jgi:hypothetical protein